MFVPMNDKFVFMTVRTETKRPQQFSKMQQTYFKIQFLLLVLLFSVLLRMRRVAF